MMTHSHETPDFVAYYDSEKAVAMIQYRNTLTSKVTAAAYLWLHDLLAGIDIAAVKGCFFDFQPVKIFQFGNIQEVRRQSGELNRTYDLSHIPVALVVKDIYQEEIVTQGMQLNPQQKRLKLVHSLEDGYQFFEAFRATLKPQSTPEE